MQDLDGGFWSKSHRDVHIGVLGEHMRVLVEHQAHLRLWQSKLFMREGLEKLFNCLVDMGFLVLKEIKPVILGNTDSSKKRTVVHIR